MASLQHLPAHRCLTTGAALIVQDKILLIKHKKLKVWLTPGGHVEPDELPHQAAERECWEETGVKVAAQSPEPLLRSTSGEHLPSPLFSHLQWMSQDNFHQRIKNSGQMPSKRDSSLNFLGCEQHIFFLYLVKPISLTNTKHQKEEVDEIGWFKLSDALELETYDDIRIELPHIFEAYKKISL